jgi:hypothetical protein
MTDRSDLLASCLNAIESGESTIEDCIKAHPEITGLLRMAVALRAQPEMKMAEAPKLSLERRLTRLMDERPRSGAPARSWHWLRVFASLAALFVVVFGLGAGLAQLARPAIPGDVLYAYKRVVERVELGFASSAAQSEVLTYIAGQRLNELKLLALRGFRTGPERRETATPGRKVTQTRLEDCYESNERPSPRHSSWTVCCGECTGGRPSR